MQNNTQINYPYLPKGRTILYVPESNPFMMEAKKFAQENNTVKHTHAIVMVKEGRVIGRGSIGGGYHGEIDSATREKRGCAREHMNVPTGTRYDLCGGCGADYHSEAMVIRDAQEHGEDPQGADVYFWGHWWCCSPCWEKMIAAGIRNVFLLEGSERLFNKEHPENIVGRQFE